MEQKFEIVVEDSLSGKTVIVEMEDKDIYDTCRRTNWNIEKNDQKHFTNTIPFNCLIGRDNGDLESFHEFISYDEDPCEKIIKSQEPSEVNKVIEMLPSRERKVIFLIYFRNKTASEVAIQLNMTKRNVNYTRKKAEEIIKKILEKNNYF